MPVTSSCAIHQPNLFPRLSTLAKLYAADVWIVLDSVQYNSRDYQHRARLAQLAEPARRQWLSLPVHRPHGRLSRIDQVRLIDRATSQRRLLRLLQQYYSRSPYWPAFRSQLLPLLDLILETDRLTDISEASARTLLSLLDWPGTVVHASDLPSQADRSARLADLTRAAGATTYLCGTGGWSYLDHQPFHTARITVRRFTVPATSDNCTTDPWASAQRAVGTHATRTGRRPT